MTDSFIAASEAGRSCPLHYQYGPAVLRAAPEADLASLDVLYVVGGLYGNELALAQVLALFDAETGRKRLVFNGDFHWFDSDPARFARIQTGVLTHSATRGNVETELSALASHDGLAGCGCAYPDWVDQAIVERSNQILKKLRRATTFEQQAALAALPMWRTAQVGDSRIAIVHGDAQSLAGWGFAQEQLHLPAQQVQIRRWFEQSQVDLFACSHTCLPVFQEIMNPARSAPMGWVLNNGAAGMPNFRGDHAGLFTRIANQPFVGTARRFGIRYQSLFIDGIALEIDADTAIEQFLQQWPVGSEAHLSYFSRISSGPQYTIDHVIRSQENLCLPSSAVQAFTTCPI